MVKKMTDGNPTKLILWFMLPLVIGNVFQQVYNLTDAVVVGSHVGVDALAGIGVANPLLFMSMGFSNGLCNGFSVVLAQRFGAGSKIGVRRCVTTSIYLGAVFSLLITILCFVFTRPILILINTPSEVLDAAITYVLTLSRGIFSLIAYNLFSGMARAVGNSKIPLIFLVFSAVVNIGLDYLNILFYNLGISGSAIATVASQVMSFILCGIYVFKRYEMLRPKKSDWKINWKYVYLHIKIAVPMGLELFVTAFGTLILQGSMNNFGTEVVAGYTAAMKVENLVIAIFSALATAIATYTAQNFGARNYKRIVSGAKSSIIIGVIWCLISAFAIMFLWNLLIGMFVNESEVEVRDAARLYMMIAMVNYPVLCFLMTFRSLVQSIGRTTAPVLAGVAEIVMRAVGASLLAGLLGYAGICCSPALAWYAAFAIVIISYIIGIKKLKKEFAHTIIKH